MAVHVPRSEAPTAPAAPGSPEVPPAPVGEGDPGDGAAPQEATGDEVQAATSDQARPGRPTRPEPEEEPDTIGVAARVLRGLAALMCLGIAVLMISNGQGLMSVWPYVIMMTYAGAAVWGLTSINQAITVRQFAIEMAALVAVTLVLRAASPEMFSEDQAQEAQEKVAVVPTLPKNALGRFVEVGLKLTKGTLELVDLKLPTQEDWQAKVGALRYESLTKVHATLSDDDKIRVSSIWKNASEFGPKMVKLAQDGVVQDAQGMYHMPGSTDLMTARRKLQDAVKRAEILKSRILVWPDEEGGED